MILENLRSDQSDFLGVKTGFLREVVARRKKYALSVDEGLRVRTMKHCVISANVLQSPM